MEFKIGDKVKCELQGSWIDGKVGTVKRLNVASSDEIHGHEVKLDDGVAVVEAEHLRLL